MDCGIRRRDFLMKRVKEDFPIDENIVEEFIKENKENWDEVKHSGKYIFVNFSMVRMQCGWIVPKLLFAKGLEEGSGAEPIVFTWNENPLLTRFIESFKVKHIAYHTVMKKDFGSMWKSWWKTIGFMLFDGTGEGLKKMEYLGVNVGMPLYEDILRTSSLSTIRSARNKVCLKKIFHLLWMAGTFDKLCKKYPIAYGVADDIAYHEGMFIKIMHKYTKKLYASNNYRERKIEVEDDVVERQSQYLNKRYKEKIHLVTDEQAQWSLQHLEERFQGKNGRAIDRGAFADKEVLGRADVEKILGLNIGKKNAVIMAHTFTDAVFNYGDTFCRDYYDWVEQTLKIAGENDKVNWILKPHPTRGAYNESEDSIEDMFARHKKDHLFLLPDEISGESIKNFADVIITIGGNAGAEFACFGVPVVIIGKPYYAGFGYTKEPKNREEYEEVLKNIQEMEPLSDEQVMTARKVFYLSNAGDREKEDSSYADEFAILSNGKYLEMIKKMPLEYFENNRGTEIYNDKILELYADYFHNNIIKETDFFMRGKKEARIKG